MQVGARDLGAADVQGDVADVVLRERRMLAARADQHAHLEPLTALHRVGRGELWGVLGVERRAQLAELWRELLLLAGGSRQRKRSGREDGLESHGASSGTSSRILESRSRGL